MNSNCYAVPEKLKTYGQYREEFSIKCHFEAEQ